MTERGINDVSGITDIHSFVVRIWLEELDEKTHRVVWHGHVTYVRNGERRYINHLNEIPEFIESHLRLNGET